MRRIFRQGDVLIVEVSEIPKDAKIEKKNGSFILAEGEATGHHHQIKKAVGVLLAMGIADRFLQLKKAAKLQHEEHGEIMIPAGNWQVIRQREYDPIQARRVLD